MILFWVSLRSERLLFFQTFSIEIRSRAVSIFATMASVVSNVTIGGCSVSPHNIIRQCLFCFERLVVMVLVGQSALVSVSLSLVDMKA